MMLSGNVARSIACLLYPQISLAGRIKSVSESAYRGTTLYTAFQPLSEFQGLYFHSICFLAFEMKSFVRRLAHGKSRAKSVNIGPTLYLAIEMGGMSSGAFHRTRKDSLDVPELIGLSDILFSRPTPRAAPNARAAVLTSASFPCVDPSARHWLEPFRHACFSVVWQMLASSHRPSEGRRVCPVVPQETQG